MANTKGENAASGSEPGEDYQDLERRIDSDASAMSTSDGGKLANKLGIPVEELDRRMHLEDARRDAAGLPPLANTVIRERANLDDFGSKPDVAAATVKRDSPFGLEDNKAQALNVVDQDKGKSLDESAAVKSLRDIRQREAQEALEKSFHHAGNSYYHKEDSARVAFMDRGLRLITQDKDPVTAGAMAMTAEARGWSTIKVSGNEQFRREVWLEASLRGIEVKGYQPKEADLAAKDIKLGQRARNGVEPVGGKEKTREEPSADEVKKRTKSMQQEEDNKQRQSERTKVTVVKAVAAAVVAEKITNPAVRQKVMTEVSRQLEKQTAQKKEVPAIRTYDKNAPAKARDVDRARPPIDRNTERTR